MVMTVAEYKKKKIDISRQEATNHVGKTHGIYDKLFVELSGLEKEDDEKTEQDEDVACHLSPARPASTRKC